MAIRQASSTPAMGPTPAAAVVGAAPAAADQQAALRRQLHWRMGTAGLLILLLLAAWPIFDYLSPPDDPMAGSPRFTEPVPVKKALPAMKVAEPLVDAPIVVPVVAGPQASGAAIEQLLPPVEASSSATNPSQAPAGSETAPAVAPLAVVPRRPLSGHVLQSSPLPDQQRAAELQARLAQEGLPSNVETRLQVGPFRSRAEAEAARRKLQTLGVAADAVLLKGGRP
ncbi:MAG: SPOR domain-containing protein [Thiobacillaceae bacterium]|nr:SPOR domain-containing protein [Thiobacillaceae bacterium]